MFIGFRIVVKRPDIDYYPLADRNVYPTHQDAKIAIGRLQVSYPGEEYRIKRQEVSNGIVSSL